MSARVLTGQSTVHYNLGRPGYLAMPTKKRVLVVSYDETLLKQRKSSLEAAGFFVTSAYGFAEASRICRLDKSFDLIVLGYTVPRNDKVSLIESITASCKAPILSIRKTGQPPLQGTHCSIDSDSEREILATAARLAVGIETTTPPSASAAS